MARKLPTRHERMPQRNHIRLSNLLAMSNIGLNKMAYLMLRANHAIEDEIPSFLLMKSQYSRFGSRL